MDVVLAKRGGRVNTEDHMARVIDEQRLELNRDRSPARAAAAGAASATDQAPILVLGGTGKTGRRVAQRLTARGLPVRIGSRSGEPPFDWEDQSTWAPALRGVEAVYVTYY